MKNFIVSLVAWLEPHNEYSRPTPKPLPESVIQTLNASTGTAKPVKKLPALQAATENKAVLSPPPTVDPPGEVTEFFDCKALTLILWKCFKSVDFSE
jgi:hypothetical protein